VNDRWRRAGGCHAPQGATAGSAAPARAGSRRGNGVRGRDPGLGSGLGSGLASGPEPSWCTRALPVVFAVPARSHRRTSGAERSARGVPAAAPGSPDGRQARTREIARSHRSARTPRRHRNAERSVRLRRPGPGRRRGQGSPRVSVPERGQASGPGGAPPRPPERQVSSHRRTVLNTPRVVLPVRARPRIWKGRAHVPGGDMSPARSSGTTILLTRSHAVWAVANG